MFNNNLKKFLVLFILTTVSFVIFSCARDSHLTTSTFVDTKTLPQGFAQGSSFALLPMQKDNQLFSKEVSQKIEKILEGKGYTVKNPDKADYYLLFNFGMTSSTGTINVPRYIPGGTEKKEGSIYGVGGSVQYQEQTQKAGSTVYVPQTYTFYTRGLLVAVYDAKIYRKTKKEEQVWQGFSVSSGESDDLRQIIDYLLVSVFKYFGKNTYKNIETNINERDEEVKKLRGELSSTINIDQGVADYAILTH